MYDHIELARRSLDAFAAGVSAEIEARALCDIRYGTGTGAWFERRHGRSRVSVSRDVKIGKKLRLGLDVLQAAVLRGEISFERVAFIAGKVNGRSSDAMSAAQQPLLELSTVEPSWALFTATVARYADVDSGHDPSDTKSRASLRRVGDELIVDGVFVGADSETMEHLVDPILADAVDPTRRFGHTHDDGCIDGSCPGRRYGVGGPIGVPVSGAGGRQVWFAPSQWEPATVRPSPRN